MQKVTFKQKKVCKTLEYWKERPMFYMKKGNFLSTDWGGQQAV